MTPKTNALVQYILFATLVVMTPFIVVTRFLQGTVNHLSHQMFTIFGIELPIVGAIAVAGVIVLIVWQRKQINLRRVIAAFVVVIMIGISYWVQDLYGGMSLYDLQKNWHYIAYGAYVFYYFRAFTPRRQPRHISIIVSFFSAIGLSLFDETFQYFLSHRIFDVSDIAKDSWGTVMGLIIMFFITETYGTLDLKWKSFWKKNILDYLKDPLGALVIVGTFSFASIVVSPLLTDHKYGFLFLGLSCILFIVIMAILHFIQFRPIRIALSVLVAVLLITGTITIARNSDNPVEYKSFGWTSFRGIPIPFFDFLVYPNGLPRLVDKKHFFNNQDRKFFLGNEPDILIMASGTSGKGGKGFKTEEGSYFVFNQLKLKSTQIIVTRTPNACRLYNRLVKEGKKVMIVVHNTC